MLFRRTLATDKLFEAWHQEWSRFGQQDQLALVRAIARTKLSVQHLTRRWNGWQTWFESISQAQDSFPEYGQGAAGYGKRYGAALTDEVSSGFFTNYVYPALLHEDPRYYRLGKGSFKHRLGYALSQEFVSHKDAGGRTFAWSNALGAVTAGSISNAYYPEADRGFELTMSRAGISLLYGSLGGLEDEFWPDIYQRIRHHRKRSSVPGDQTEK